MAARAFLACSALMIVAACGGEVSPAPEGQTIECAIGAGAEMGPDCVGELVVASDEQVFVIHHPDGSFQRFEMLPNDAGIGLADGAGVLSQERDGDMLLLTTEDARYRLPIAQTQSTE